MLILKVAKALDHGRIDYAIVGGMAVALQGVARGTLDIDIVIRLTEKDFLGAEAVFLNLGFVSRLPIDGKMTYNFREEYIKKRNLIAWTFYNPKAPHEVVDIVLTHNRAKMKIDRISVAGYKIKVASIDDLIKMKMAAGREQDLEDVKSLRDLK